MRAGAITSGEQREGRGGEGSIAGCRLVSDPALSPPLPRDQIQKVQASAEGGTPRGAGGDAFGERGGEPAAPLPVPSLATLPALADALTDAGPFDRDRLASSLLAPGYLASLGAAFAAAEDLDDPDSLAAAYRAAKAAVLLNDASLLEELLSDEHADWVLGALEYEPAPAGAGPPPPRAAHRAFVARAAALREAVPLPSDALRAKARASYRATYVKDVALPRALDDGAHATLASLAVFNAVEVLVALQADPSFLPALFAQLAASPPPGGGWRDGIALLQEMVDTSRHLQAGARGALLARMASLGLYDVMAAALTMEEGKGRGEGGADAADPPLDPDASAALRAKAADVLLSAASHDPAPLREYLLTEGGRRVLDSIVDTALGGGGKGGAAAGDATGAAAAAPPADGAATAPSTAVTPPSPPSSSGLADVAVELLRALLDPETMAASAETAPFLEAFYDRHVGALVAALAGCADDPPPADAPPPTALAAAAELLCFCAAAHSYRMKYYSLRHGVVAKVLTLLKRREAWLRCAAVRFARACVGLRDDFYSRHFVRSDLLRPLLAARPQRRRGLYDAALLDLIEFVRRENVAPLVAHLVADCGAELESLDAPDMVAGLRLRAAQNEAQADGGELRAGEEGPAIGPLPPPIARGGLNPDEESYFEGDDDEDDGGAALAAGGGAWVGGPPPTRAESPPLDSILLQPLASAASSPGRANGLLLRVAGGVGEGEAVGEPAAAPAPEPAATEPGPPPADGAGAAAAPPAHPRPDDGAAAAEPSPAKRPRPASDGGGG